MLLIDREWKDFKLNDLFLIYTGEDLIINRVKNGNIPIISHKAINNGIACWSELIPKRKMFSYRKTISLADRGNFKAYVQKCDFYIGTRVKALEIKSNVSLNVLFFIANQIDKQSFKFSYGYNATDNVGNISIMLPINESGNPDYDFMDIYIRNIVENKKKEYNSYINDIVIKLEYKEIPLLEEKRWNDFFITDIFPSIQRGKRIIKVKQISGIKPYISSTTFNNGVDNFISNDKNVRIFSNCLSIANSGGVGASFYHPYEFVASDHVTNLKNEKMNMYTYLFIATITNRFSEKYNFNREINDKRISREKIILPINKNKKPDFEYMEQYIKNLIINKYDEYLEYNR